MKLGPDILSRVDHYLYLGVYLHERLSWKLQYDKVSRATRCSSWKVCRWVRQAQASNKVTLPVVRQLVLACVRSAFGYALPIWRPTQSQVRSLQRCMITPLRACLRLPRTTSSVGLLIECAIPDVQTWAEHLALRLARRIMKLPDNHSARVCFELRHDSILPIERIESNRYFCTLPFGQLVCAIEGRWFGLNEDSYFGVDDGVRSWTSFLSPDLKLSTPELLTRCYNMAAVDQRAPYLLAVKQGPGLPPYLKHDGRVMASHRARLRLNRAKLNSSLAERRLVDDEFCDHCQDDPDSIPQEETVEHVLIYCPRYKVARSRLMRVIVDQGDANVKLDLQLVLGEAWFKKYKDLIRAVRRFLSDVHRDRDF